MRDSKELFEEYNESAKLSVIYLARLLKCELDDPNLEHFMHSILKTVRLQEEYVMKSAMEQVNWEYRK